MSKTIWPLMDDIITWGDRIKMVKFILTTNRFTNGPKVRKFESEWNDWLGSKYSLFVNSGSSANLLLLSAVKEKYGLKNGDKVLVPACTWSTNIAPVIHTGFEPIFADIDLHSFSFDVEKLKKVKEIHPDIKIIFVTHLLGLEAELDKYQEVFPDALVLEDICEAQGVTNQKGEMYGSNSLGATFSLYFSHHMTSIEGGIISTNDKELYELMRMKRSAGMAREASDEKFQQYKKENPDISPSFLFPTAGFNLRNHEICAVLGSSQLKRIDHIIKCRRNNYQKFLSLLKKYPDKFYIPKEDNTSSNLCLPFICKEKYIYSNLIMKLEEYGIEYRPIVAGNLLKQPFLKDYYIVGDGPFNVDIVHEQGVYIGNSHLVKDKNFKLIEEIIDNV
jgi:CDP-6-deoxy-D-xylo-4-hexulose-3-dehydrase